MDLKHCCLPLRNSPEICAWEYCNRCRNLQDWNEAKFPFCAVASQIFIIDWNNNFSNGGVLWMKEFLEWTWPRKELLVPISLYSNSGTHTHSYVPQFDATEAIHLCFTKNNCYFPPNIGVSWIEVFQKSGTTVVNNSYRSAIFSMQ